MFDHEQTRQGSLYRFSVTGYQFHVLHSVSGRWTVYEMDLEPHGKTFLDAGALVEHYPVAWRELRDIVGLEGADERCRAESMAG